MTDDERSEIPTPTLIPVGVDVYKCSLCELREWSITVNRANPRTAKLTRAELDREHEKSFAEHVRISHSKKDGNGD
jgi:hypothetical protein